MVHWALLVFLMITMLSHLEFRDCGDAGGKALVFALLHFFVDH
jgi:hypothetical protein